jgi:hypothetical protein
VSPTNSNRSLLAVVLIAAIAAACSFDDRGVPAVGSSSGAGGPGARTGDGGVPLMPSGIGGPGTAGGLCGTGDPKGSSCVGELYQGKALPLDVFVMFDESGSMATMDDGVTMRIDAVRAAVGQFLQDPDSAGVGVGIGYFGTQPLSCACTSCNAADYATPAVPIAVLPGAAPAVIASLARQAPTGETPTGAALRGACTYANGAKQAQPGHNVVILLVTDGVPQAPLTSQAGGCNPTLADATAAASSCFASGAQIRTYVLGVGPSLSNLDQIAAAGGTGRAHLVESGGAAGVLEALGAIRKDAMIPCSLEIPRGASGSAAVDPNTVNVVYADASCTLTTLVNVRTSAGCDPQRGGWYYDDPARPASIQLCGASCAAVAAPGAQLRISVGCSTLVID